MRKQNAFCVYDKVPRYTMQKTSEGLLLENPRKRSPQETETQGLWQRYGREWNIVKRYLQGWDKKY